MVIYEFPSLDHILSVIKIWILLLAKESFNSLDDFLVSRNSLFEIYRFNWGHVMLDAVTYSLTFKTSLLLICSGRYNSPIPS